MSGNTPFFDSGLEIGTTVNLLTHKSHRADPIIQPLILKLGKGHPTVMSCFTFCEVVLSRQIDRIVQYYVSGKFQKL